MSDESDLKNLEFDEPSSGDGGESNLVSNEEIEPIEVSFEFEESGSGSEKESGEKQSKEKLEVDKETESLDLSIAEVEEEVNVEDLGFAFESDSEEEKVSQVNDSDKLDVKSESDSEESLSFSLEDDDKEEDKEVVVEEVIENEVSVEVNSDLTLDQDEEAIDEEKGEVLEEETQDNIDNQDSPKVEDDLDAKLKEIEDLKSELSEDFQSKDYFNDLEDKNKQTKEDFLSQYENYEELLESRNRTFPIDIVIYIVLGGIFLIVMNYYFFRSSKVPEVKSTPKVEKIKKVANKKKKKKIKKQELKIEDLSTKGKEGKLEYSSDLRLENGLVKKLSMQVKVEAPDPLTDKEIVADKVLEPWIKRANFSDISIVQTNEGDLFGTGKSKVYFEYKGKKTRVLSDVRIAGKVSSKNVAITVVITNDINKPFKHGKSLVTIVDGSDNVFFKITEKLEFKLN